MAVKHIAATPLPVSGYAPRNLVCDAAGSQDGCYRLELMHYQEPDAVDRVTPDSKLITDALCVVPGDDEPCHELGEFRTYFRDETSHATWTRVDRTPGAEFAIATPGQAFATAACVQLELTAYDAFGDLAASQTTQVSVSAGTLVSDCTAQTPVAQPASVTFAGSTALLSYLAPATAGQVTLTAGTVQSVFSVYTAGSTAPTVLSLSDLAGPVRGFVQGGTSGRITLSLPSAPATPVLLELRVDAATAVVDCAEPFNPSGVPPDNTDPTKFNCPNQTGVTGTTAPPCHGERNFQTCAIAMTGATYELLLDNSATGLITLTINDVRATPSLPNQRYTVTSFGGATFSYNGYATSGTSAAITGYISWAGDHDFFRLQLPTEFPARATMNIKAQHGPSPLDLRAQGTRSDEGAGVTTNGENADDDLCGSCQNGAACDDRGYCTRQAGVTAEAGPRHGDCVYLQAGGNLEVVVNDVLYNDWDITQPYYVWIEMIEGCPSTCNAAICGQ
jgi:hypothetical protein